MGVSACRRCAPECGGAHGPVLSGRRGPLVGFAKGFAGRRARQGRCGGRGTVDRARLFSNGRFAHSVSGGWSSGGPELSQAGRAERASGRLNTGRSNGRARDEQRVGWNARRSNRHPRSRIPVSWNARRSGRARQGRKRVGWNAGRSTRRPRSRIPGSWNARRSGRAREGRKRVGWNAGRSTRRIRGSMDTNRR